MIPAIIFIPLILTISVLTSSFIFYVLLKRELKLIHSVRMISAAHSLNKFLFSGSGYAAISLKLKAQDLPAYKTVSSFALLELLSFLPWVALGFYFGPEIALKVPLVFIVLLAVILPFSLFRKKRLAGFFKNAFAYFNEIKLSALAVLPLVLLNVACGVFYYFFLLRAFGLTLSLLDILKITSVTFTVSYLSPSPSGLGFKEGSLVFLLMQKSVPFKNAAAIAVADRAIICVFYLILGALVAISFVLERPKKNEMSAIKQNEKCAG
ncbi:MAG: lysylphosphatidylglycerol synthase domain-containing protein [Candidatus Omnitrophica bacterium]|nr:lysylphosphatidylglycerol synthase domain-containing protein [Candidatus Omnitrophota bacterium]